MENKPSKKQTDGSDEPAGKEDGDSAKPAREPNGAAEQTAEEQKPEVDTVKNDVDDAKATNAAQDDPRPTMEDASDPRQEEDERPAAPLDSAGSAGTPGTPGTPASAGSAHAGSENSQVPMESPDVGTEAPGTPSQSSAAPMQSGVSAAEPLIGGSGADDTWRTKLNDRGWLRATAYLPEYLLMLITLIGLLTAMTMLVSAGVEYLASLGEDSTQAGPYAVQAIETIDTLWVLSSLAAAIVLLPLFAVLYVRTLAVEREEALIQRHRWRKAFLGIFITVEVLTIVWWLSGLVFDLLSRAVLFDGVFDTLDGAKDPLWQPVVTTALAAVLIGYVVWVISRRYGESHEEAQSGALAPRKRALLPVVLAVISVALICLQIPALYQEYKQQHDAQASQDIEHIANYIEDYVSEENELPDTLSGLALGETYYGDSLQRRLDNYDYKPSEPEQGKYKLCATFLTDTSDGSSEEYAGSPLVSSYYDYDSGPDTSEHPKGYHCFTYETHITPITIPRTFYSESPLMKGPESPLSDETGGSSSAMKLEVVH